MNDVYVGTYLTARMEQLGIRHLFAVPGDYTSDLLAIIDQQSNITRIGMCNELNAGYAADGYARVHGLAAVSVTSGVGAFSLLNAVAGSDAEMIPVVVIIGTLSNTSRLLEINAGRQFHHQVSTADKNQEIYRNVTVRHERIADPLLAPMQIDRALIDCITYRRPVLIEIVEDCYRLPCRAPEGALRALPLYTSYTELKRLSGENKHAAEVAGAIDGAAAAVYSQLRTARKPVFWIGNEVAIYNLQDKVRQLLSRTRAPFVSSLLGKASLSEATPGFVGIYEGVFTSDYTAQYTDASDCIIGLGVWNTDINVLGIKTPQPGNPSPIFASRDVVKVGPDLFVQVSLENLLDALIALIQNEGYTPVWEPVVPRQDTSVPASSDPITFDRFFSVLNRFLTTNHLVIADIGVSANGGSAFLDINRENGYLVQALWASIGWSVPAGLGASFLPGTRTIVIVGDGAFKLTCQEIATMVHSGRNTIVFVMNNGVYAVEQMFLDPAPFRPGSRSEFEAANVLQRWDYESLMKAFSNGDSARGMAAKVCTVGDLNEVLRQISQYSEACWLVDIHLDKRDYPAAWMAIVGTAH